MRILLVHQYPEPELTRDLAREGHDVLTVAETERPERFLGVFKPAVVLVIGLDAAETCRELRRRGPDVAIVAIVLSRDVDERVAALEAGADDCLGTPVVRAELSARIRAARRRRTLTTAGAPIAGTPSWDGVL